MNRWTVLRAVGIVFVVGLLGSIELGLRGQSAQLRNIETRIVALDAKLHQAGEARRLQPLVASAEGARSGKAAAHEGKASKHAPSAGARAKTKGSTFSALLDRLYDAADQLAAEEEWTPETYDRVSAVFEWTAGEMLSLQKQVQGKELNVADAKQAAIRIRDQASDQLGEVLGPDAMTRLKAAWVEERAPR